MQRFGFPYIERKTTLFYRLIFFSVVLSCLFSPFFLSLFLPLPPLYLIMYVMDLIRTFVFFSTLKVLLFFLLPSGLALLGCCVSEETMKAAEQVLESICPKLNLHSQPSVISLSTTNQIKQYLERHSLQFCVLVVDGETIKDAYENLPARKVEYEDLFKTAVERVGKIRAHFVINKINVSTLFFSHPIYLINFIRLLYACALNSYAAHM